MNERCPVCDLKFEREEGYFLGAMYISYGLALVFIVAPAALLWGLFHWSIQKSVIWGLIFFLPMAPLITLFSRVLWIYLDQTIDPCSLTVTKPECLSDKICHFPAFAHYGASLTA
jgi:hypothetical protein